MKLPGFSPAAWIATHMIFVQGFGLALFAIQAPLLGPRAFGLITIVMVFVGFCEYVLSEAGADALVSIRDIESRHYDTMTAVFALFSALLGLAVYLAADAIAGWFGDAELAPVLRWMSVLPLLSALTAAPSGATRRDLLFRPLALRGIASVVIGGVVGLALTLLDKGVWALVWQAIVQRGVAVVVLWLAVPIRFRLALSGRHFVELYRYAAPLIWSRTMDWISGQVPRSILGLYLGASELGLFSLASRLNDILLGITVSPRYAVARVELRRYAGEPQGLEATMRALLVKTSLLTFPLAIGGAALAPTLFHAWLDPRWYEGIAVAQCLLLMVLPMVTYYLVGALLIALNRQAVQALISTVQTVTTVLVVWLAAPFGIVPASAAVAARPVLLLPLPLWLATRQAGLSWRIVLGAQAPVFVAAALMGIIIWLIEGFAAPMIGAAPLLAALVLLGALIYAGLIRLLLPEVARAAVERLAQRLGTATVAGRG